MRSHNFSSLAQVSNLLAKSCIRVDYKDVNSDPFENDIDDYMCDFENIEEIFEDHLRLGNRLRKTLYAGNISDSEDHPDHPPIALTGLALELFSKAVPNDGLDRLNMDYVSYATEAAQVPPCAMIVALIYLERLKLKNSDYLDVVSPTGLFIVTMLVASKFLYENIEDLVTNDSWARDIDYDVKELNQLERDFLAAIDWKVLVTSSDYFNYLLKIEKTIATRQSSLRKWMSYSDICTLLHEKTFETFWAPCFKRIMKAMVLCTLGYVTTALTINAVGYTIYKLMEGKQEMVGLSTVDSTINLHNQVQNLAKSFNSNLVVKNEEELLMLTLSFETSTPKTGNFGLVQEYESGENYKYQTTENVCETSESEMAYSTTSSSNIKIQVIENLTTSLASNHQLILINNSYNHLQTSFRQNDSISLVM